MDEAIGADDARLISARALRDLALEFVERSQAAEAGLLAAFATAAARWAGDVGPIVVDSDDDEQLVLRGDGVVAGLVLDEETGTWLRVETPEDVVRYYDPTDVFLDVAAALLEAFPAVEEGEEPGAGELEMPAGGASPEPPETAGTWDSAIPGEAAESPGTGVRSTLTMLEDLRRAGVLTDEQFERLRSQLDPGAPGSRGA